MKWCLNDRKSLTLQSRRERQWGKSLLLDSTGQGFPTFGRDLPVHFEIFSGDFLANGFLCCIRTLLDSPHRTGSPPSSPNPLHIPNLQMAFHAPTTATHWPRSTRENAAFRGEQTQEQWVFCRVIFFHSPCAPQPELINLVPPL